jgi:hypothetical protein
VVIPVGLEHAQQHNFQYRETMKISIILLSAWLAASLSFAAEAKCYTCSHRSSSAKTEFKHSHPCPSTGESTGACPGYVIDHVKPLKRGGKDAPSNMQWQTKDAAKAKDKWE